MSHSLDSHTPIAAAGKQVRGYSFAHLGGDFDLYAFRLRGVGLANMLFPWARSIVAAERFGLIRIAPTWPQIAHRHWMRRDPDKRWYGNLFQPDPMELTGIQRWNRLLFGQQVEESKLAQGIDEDDVVVFSGMEGFFRDVLREHELVRARLLRVVRPKYLRPVQENFRAPIAVHVRLGDFKPPPEDGSSRDNYRTNLSWYEAVISSLHAALGPLDTHIFSDGTDQELAPLLAMPSVRRTSFQHSISDMLALSNSAILVASNSSFSMWAAYLGRQPVVRRPDWLTNKIYYENPSAELESSGTVPDGFLAHCIDSLKRKQTLQHG